jgi:hypothetical protein
LLTRYPMISRFQQSMTEITWHHPESSQKKCVMSVAHRSLGNALTDRQASTRGRNPFGRIFTPHPFLRMMRCTFFLFTTNPFCLLADRMVTKLTNNPWMNPVVWLVSRELTEAAGLRSESLALDDDGEYFAALLPGRSLSTGLELWNTG